MLKIFYSNRTESLLKDLKHNLFFSSSSSPFARRLLIVPTAAIKAWLILQLSQDKELEVVAGLEILYLHEAQSKIYELISKKKDSYYIPNLIEIMLAIEGNIRKVALNWNLLPPSKREQWQPLMDYLKITFQSHNPLKLKRQSEKRLALLSETLAKLFIDYGKYGHRMVSNWNDSSPGWQQALWHHIFSTGNNKWVTPSYKIQTLELINQPPPNVSIHLFSINFIPQSECLLFEKAANLLPVFYYSLSPCSLFWTDILTHKETQKLKNFWNKKKAPLEQQTVLRDYLHEKNSLLANWGKLGRKMAELLEKSEYETFTRYFLPESIQRIDVYSDYDEDCMTWENSNRPPSLLDYLHADILMMRNPHKDEKILVEHDASIQLHQAPTKQREIQALYHTLLNIIEKEGTIEPRDIIVMAPDIMQYAPYIRQTFGESESLLDFQVMDMHALSEDSLIKQFWHLIDLPFGRWNTGDILFLFNFSNFQKKHRLSLEDVKQIRTWVIEAGILWGNDISHRNEILHQRYDSGMIEDTKKGTWEGGFDDLLFGLAMASSIDMEFNQGILLGKWMTILRSLQQHLKILTDGSQKTYQEWIHELKDLIGIFLCEEENEEANEDLYNRLDEFASSARWICDEKVTFIALRQHLQTLFNQHTFIYHENHLQAVKFCSMLPMRAIPAKVIALIGMDENAFPREDSRLSLNLMKEEPLSDYCPSHTDYDRYLFLEALLSARQYFILSYSDYASEDGQEQASSPLVSELMAYINQAYTIGQILYTHPYHSYDAHYFSANSNLKNYSKSDFRAALSYYKPNKKPQHHFIPDFNYQKDNTRIVDSEITIDIKQIKIAIQNPLKHYLSKTLGIYLHENGHAHCEEPFVIDPLQMYGFKKASLKQHINEIIQKAEKQGKMPLGLFKKSAVSEIQDNINKYHERLDQWGIDANKIFEITLHEKYEHPFFDEHGWKLPPWEIKYKGQTCTKIMGTLSEISDKGLLANIYGNTKDATKAWGDFIFLCNIIDHYRLPIEKQVLCLKSGNIKNAFFENPITVFEEILDFYFQSLRHISPLQSEWHYDLVHQDTENLQKAIDQSLNDEFNPMYNEYIKWVCRHSSFDAANIIEHWQTQAKKMYSPLYKAWTSKDED